MVARLHTPLLVMWQYGTRIVAIRRHDTEQVSSTCPKSQHSLLGPLLEVTKSADVICDDTHPSFMIGDD